MLRGTRVGCGVFLRVRVARVAHQALAGRDHCVELLLDRAEDGAAAGLRGCLERRRLRDGVV